ncbi:MAG: hypothetical protein GC189_11685 [Alphaproteobacteria bacterium]|nr:hypothetical protein [Alphaproteobacteria bacterium]
MTAFPIGANAAEARADGAKTARTAEAAEEALGGAAFLAVEELPEAFASPQAAEAAFPDLYGVGTYELYWREGAWRVALRFWRPAPPAPVARNVAAAVRRPLGHARTPEEARGVLGGPAERVSETLPKLYRTRHRAMAQWGALVNQGLAEIVEREGKLAVAVHYWRPLTSAARPTPLAPAERHELAERLAAPLKPSDPQAPLDVGLFESPAPENPDIVLAEEGDGRVRGE